MAFEKSLFADGNADVNEFVADAVNISDTLSNLAYMIEIDAEHPGLVRQYARQADQLLRALEDLLYAASPEACVSVVP